MKARLMGILACVALPLARATPIDSRMIGVLPAADSSERRFALTLFGDGSAALRTDFAEKGSVEERGRWDERGGRLELDLAGPGAPVVWQRRGQSLVPVSWNLSEWGSVGPPELKLAGSR